jgi:hypothetical protein
MQTPVAAEVDAVEEFRIRSWARDNYVPAAQRDAGWHPVALDEMRQRDSDLAERPVALSRIYAIVPLAPDEIWRHHPPHALEAPHFAVAESPRILFRIADLDA